MFTKVENDLKPLITSLIKTLNLKFLHLKKCPIVFVFLPNSK